MPSNTVSRNAAIALASISLGFWEKCGHDCEVWHIGCYAVPELMIPVAEYSVKVLDVVAHALHLPKGHWPALCGAYAYELFEPLGAYLADSDDPAHIDVPALRNEMLKILNGLTFDEPIEGAVLSAAAQFTLI